MNDLSCLKKFWLLIQLRRNAWQKTEDLLKLQEKKLRAIVKHAYENVEFYHRKFNSSNLKPSDIKTVQDLKKIPITTKQEVQENYPNGIVARGVDFRKCKKYRTSGSTGKPLSVILDANAEDYRAALFGRPFLECGLKLRDKMVEIVDQRHIKRKKEWYQHLGLLRRFYVSAAQSVEEQLPLMIAYRPNAIFGYSSWLYLLAKAIDEMGLSLSPKLMFSTAEILTQEQRRYLETCFKVDVFDFYGCVEVERVAWECTEHNGYHLDIDSVVTEFVKANEEVSSGERGKILLTCLYNYAMPLIRYDIEDLGVPSDEKCTCGRGLPLMKCVEGRADDMVIALDGKVFVPENFAQMMRNIPGIGQYRVIQEKKDMIVVQIVKGKGFTLKTTELITEEFRQILGSEVQVKPIVVDNIKRDSCGKLRAVLSKIKIPE